MLVVAVAGRNLGSRDWQVGSGGIVEMRDQPLQPGRGLVENLPQVASGSKRVLLQAGNGLAAFQLHEQEERRLGLCDAVEAAALGDQRLDRELGRQPAGNVSTIRDRPGLV